MKKNRKKWSLLLLILVLMAFFSIICVKKHKGIVNIFFKLTGIEAPYEWKAYAKKKYGSYKQKIKVKADMDQTVPVYENDSVISTIETSIPSEDTLVKTSLEIDMQVQSELESGYYTFEEPLVILNPYKISPLTALALFHTDENVRVRMTVKGKTDAADISFESEAAEDHRIPIIGLYPNMENTIILELLNDTGTVLKKQEVTLQTEKLPEYMDDIIRPVTTSDTSAYELTIVSGQKSHYPFAYDHAGDVRWYFDRQTANYGLYSLSNGRLIFQDNTGYVPSPQKPQSTNLYELDYLGRAYSMYYLPGGSHHEVIEKEPGGNLLALTSSMEGHFEDEIVELDRLTGEIVNELELTEIFGETYVDKMDWAHINTVAYHPEDDSIIISPRNLHSSVKIDWTNHKLKWILCDPRFWEGTDFEKYVLQPEGDFTWHYQQHTTYQISTDLDKNPDTVELTLFDNHQHASRKLSYFEKTDESYSLVYSINEEKMTVQQLKRFPVIYSKITSNTIYDEESNHIFSMCGWVPDSDIEKRQGMTYEMDYDTGEILNQYTIKYTFYRAFEMNVNYSDLCSAMTVDANYIKGSLRPAVTTSKKAPIPKQILSEDISFKVIGSVLYIQAYDHHIAQIIFKGKNNTYVYDNTDIPQFSEEYLAHVGDIPVPLSNMSSDTYDIYVVYLDEYYQTGQTFSIL